MNQDTLKGQWKQWIGRARNAWGKLTDDELLQIEGNAQRLTGLVQQRYGTTRAEAESQVRTFFDGVSAALDSKARQPMQQAASEPGDRRQRY